MTTIPPTRYLVNLDAAIAAATDPVAADCLRAERAAYLARQGQVAEATQELDAIRKRHAFRPNAAVSAWVSLAEGIMIHFTDMGPQALDRVQRAYALSTAADLRPIRAISAAWLAHLEYLSGNARKCIAKAREALDLSGSENLLAELRASMVLALSLHLAGLEGASTFWYSRARRSATQLGDGNSLAAIEHNAGWLRACSLRRFDMERNPATARMAKMSAQSAAQLDMLIGTKSLETLHPLLWAFICSAEKRFGEALNGYRSHLREGRTPDGLKGMNLTLHADMARCLAHTGDVVEAAEVAILVKAADDGKGHPDDEAMTYQSLAEVYAILGDAQAAAEASAKSISAWDRHACYQVDLIAELDRSGFITRHESH